MLGRRCVFWRSPPRAPYIWASLFPRPVCDVPLRRLLGHFKCWPARKRHCHGPSRAARLASSSPVSQAARSKESCLRPREGENKNDKEHGVSYSGDDIMGLMERDNMALIPAAFSPHGHAGPPFHRRMYGHDSELHLTFNNRPNANTCEDSASHSLTLAESAQTNPHTTHRSRQFR